MAKITATQLVLGDSTIISSKYSVVGQSTRMIFYQASAPTGWSTVNISEHTIRVVTGVGGGSGGTTDFSSSLVDYSLNTDVPLTINSLTIGNTTLTSTQMPTHAHPLNGGGSRSEFNTPSPAYVNSQNIMSPGGANTGNSGNGVAHTHPVSFTSANAPATVSGDMRVRYSNVLVCSRT